jgi:hypothetical protein
MDDLCLRTVSLSFPRNKVPVAKVDSGTWISMLEQKLSCDFENYSITVTTDIWQQTTFVEIVFATIEEATWFKMTQKEW